MLDRRDVVKRLLALRGDDLVVSGLGAPTYDVAAAGDDDRNFYTWGGMGGAAMIGLGLALAQPTRRVIVITGDGELLMGMGSLATIAQQQPANLAIVALDNARFGETGMQASHTAGSTNLTAIARGAGIAAAFEIRTEAELASFVKTFGERRGLLYATIHISPDEVPRVLPERDGVRLKERFRARLTREDTRA